MGRKSNAITVERRRDDLEGRMRSGGWCRKMARQVADEYGIELRQVYRDRDFVLDAWARNLGHDDRRREAARLLEEVRALRSATAEKGLEHTDGSVLRCAVQLMTLEADLLRLREPMQVEVTVRQDDPETLAREVVALLPFASEILDIPIPENVIEAAYTEPAGTDG